MPTTIQVSDTTKQMLEMLKKEKRAKTHDMLIQQLVQADTQIPKSVFGAAKWLSKWKKEDRAGFREL